MKKILIIIFTLFTMKAFAVDKSTTFNNEIFQKAQLEEKLLLLTHGMKLVQLVKHR